MCLLCPLNGFFECEVFAHPLPCVEGVRGCDQHHLLQESLGTKHGTPARKRGTFRNGLWLRFVSCPPPCSFAFGNRRDRDGAPIALSESPHILDVNPPPFPVCCVMFCHEPRSLGRVLTIFMARVCDWRSLDLTHFTIYVGSIGQID